MKSKSISAWSYKTSTQSLLATSVSHCEISSNEILVENEIAGINPVDWKFIQSNPLSWKDGHTPGVDGVGRVLKVGKNVSESLLDQRVAFHQSLKKQGSFARFTVLSTERVMKVPENMSSAFISLDISNVTDPRLIRTLSLKLLVEHIRIDQLLLLNTPYIKRAVSIFTDNTLSLSTLCNSL